MAMAAQLAIAKASFAAALLKSDSSLPSSSRDTIEQYHGLLGATIAQCSPTNVQKCKQWILQHLVPSPARLAAFGKFLVALANSFTTPEQGGGSMRQSRGPSAKRKRLHVLYLLNDVFFHVKFRLQDDAVFDAVAPHLPALIRSAASFTNSPRHAKKLEDLVQIWEEKGYFSASTIEQLRAAIAGGPTSKDYSTNGTRTTPSNLSREVPYLLPSTHGDVSTPWYDLPAGNWLPVIEPNSTRPMNPDMIRPLQLAGGPPDKKLVEAVKKLLVDVDKIYAKDLRLDGDATVDISQMGELIERDEITGGIIGGETYYGWSRAFCDKMKARRRKGNAKDSDGSRRGRRDSSQSSSRSRNPSRGRSSSRESGRRAFKRRRVSTSQSRSRSRSRSPRTRGGNPSRSRSPSYSPRGPSPSYSPSPPRGLGNQNGQAMSRSRHSPAAAAPPPPPPPPAGPPASMPMYMPNYGNNPGGNYNAPRPNFDQSAFPGNMPPFPPPPQAGGPGFSSWNVTPPPPPPQYQGQWPAPPAGGPSQNWYQQPAQSNPSPNQWAGGWPPPPPPPPLPQQHQQQGGFQPYGGRGGNNNGGYRGRGGYNRRGW